MKTEEIEKELNANGPSGLAYLIEEEKNHAIEKTTFIFLAIGIIGAFFLCNVFDSQRSRYNTSLQELQYANDSLITYSQTPKIEVRKINPLIEIK